MRNFVIGCIVLFIMAGTAFSETKEPPKKLSVELGKGVKLEMVLIPAGEFMMGSPDSDKDALSWEKPQHRVRITKPFYLGKYQVTQEQWEAVMGNNPSYFKGPKNPVERVSWEDCQQFLGKLNAKSVAGGGKFQLPNEAQWEYACRAGSKTRYCFGDDESKLGEYAWYAANSGTKTHPVGEKKPNAWGLYDMHGNVWEWCQDWYEPGITRSRQWTIRRVLPRARPACVAAVAGTTRRGLPVGGPLPRRAWASPLHPGLACLPRSGGQVKQASGAGASPAA